MIQPSIPTPSTAWAVAFAAGSLGTQVVFAVAPAFVPLALAAQGVADPWTIGMVLAIGPIAGLVALPIASHLGDRRASGRWNRQLPFLAFAAPTTLVGLVGLGLAAGVHAVACAMALTFVALNVFLGPYRAAAGEVLAPDDLTRVAGFQTAFKGLGTLLVLGGGGLAFGWASALPFLGAAVVFAAGTAIAMAALARVRPAARGAAVAPRPLWRYLREARELHFLFAAHMCWWFAFHGVFAFTAPFVAQEILGGVPGTAAGRAAAAAAVPILAAFAATSMVAAVPIARAAARFGGRPVLAAGLVLAIAAALVAAAASTAAQAYAFAAMAGVGFACVQVIPFPLMAAGQPPGEEGNLAALFEMLIDVPQVAAVLAVGALAAAAGTYRVTFVAAAAALALALALLALAPRRAGSAPADLPLAA